MADVTIKSFDELVQDQATAIQALAPVTIDVGVGTVLRAIVESNAALGLWLEGLILRVLSLTRAATSNDTDLDTFVADFALTRVAGTAASGNATFFRSVPTQIGVVPVGAEIDTVDGSRTFVVQLDTANANYVSTLGGYRLSVGINSISVPVKDSATGAAGNISASTLTKLTTPIQYVDGVTNALPFTNGTDPESDDQLRARFVAYLASLSRGTLGAIGFAVSSVDGVTSYAIVENKQVNGSTDFGFFYVVVDDGSGAPPSTLLDTVAEAVEDYRAVGVRYTVVAPIVVTANVTANVTVSDAGYVESDVLLEATEAVETYIAGLGLGEPLYWTKVASTIYEASGGVVNVSGTLVNGSTSDIVPSTSRTVVRPGAVSLAAV